MSKYMNAKYKRDARKRAKDQHGGSASKKPSTSTEVNVKAARGNTCPTSGWDAGEGPSTRGRRNRTIFRTTKQMN